MTMTQTLLLFWSGILPPWGANIRDQTVIIFPARVVFIGPRKVATQILDAQAPYYLYQTTLLRGLTSYQGDDKAAKGKA